MRRIGPMLAIVSLAGVAITGYAQVPAVPPVTLQQRLDEAFSSVLNTCLKEKQLATLRSKLRGWFGKGPDHVIPKRIAEQHVDDLKRDAFVFDGDLGGLFYSLWLEDGVNKFRQLPDGRFDLKERSIESSGDLSFGEDGDVKRTRHLFDCSMVIAAAINGGVNVPKSVIESALKASYSFEGSQNAGISLLYARFDSRIPDALDRDTIRDAKDVFGINLNLWRTYRKIESSNPELDTSKLRILKSHEGFSVNTAINFSTGFQAVENIDATNSLPFLKAHGSVTLNSQSISDGSTTKRSFITTNPLREANFVRAPSLQNLVQLVAQSGNKLIERDVGFPAQLEGNSVKLPYRVPLPQALCRQDLLVASDGSPTVTTEWKTAPTAYCRRRSALRRRVYRDTDRIPDRGTTTRRPGRRAALDGSGASTTRRRAAAARSAPDRS